MISVNRKFERPAMDVVQRFAGKISTGYVADANGRRGGLDWCIRPIIKTALFAGSALTVRSAPSDNLAAYAALTVAQPGDVLVLATENCTSAAVIGDVYLGMARNIGVAGVITDGMVRDIEGIEAIGLPVFARGVCPNSPWKNGPGSIGVPVSVGGVSIDSGDLVVGDSNGVVIVPRACIPRVLQELDAVRVKEEQADAAVSAGVRIPGWLTDYFTKNPMQEIDS